MPLIPRSRTRTAAWTGVAVLAALLSWAVLGTHELGGFVERRLVGALEGRTEGLYSARLGSLRVRLAGGKLLARDLSVFPDSTALERRKLAGRPPRFLARVEAGQVAIDGLWLAGWLFGRNLQVRADFFRAEGGAITVETAGTSGVRVHRLAGWQIEAERPQVKPRAPRLGRSLRAADLRAAAESYEMTSEAGVYRLAIATISASTRDSTLRVGRLDFSPTLSESELREARPEEATRYEARSGDIEVRGLDFDALSRQKSIFARSVVVREMAIEVASDLRRSRPSERPRGMPDDALRRLPLATLVDTLRIINGAVQYAEIPRDGSRPGVIRFRPIEAQVVALGNVTGRDASPPGSRRAPVALTARTRVLEAGAFELRAELHLSSADFDFRYEARSLGPLEMPALNPMFVPNAGVRIDSGRCDSLWLSARAGETGARGELRAIYRDLHVSMVDKNDGESSLPQKLASLYANTFQLHEDNLAGGEDAPRLGRIAWDHPRHEPFFAYWWRSIRSGLYSVIGMEEPHPRSSGEESRRRTR